MDNSQATINKLIDILLYKVELLPDNPLREVDWVLIDSPYEWDGVNFESENFYLQISIQGRVKMFTVDLRCIFESQI